MTRQIMPGPTYADARRERILIDETAARLGMPSPEITMRFTDLSPPASTTRVMHRIFSSASGMTSAGLKFFVPFECEVVAASLQVDPGLTGGTVRCSLYHTGAEHAALLATTASGGYHVEQVFTAPRPLVPAAILIEPRIVTASAALGAGSGGIEYVVYLRRKR